MDKSGLVGLTASLLKLVKICTCQKPCLKLEKTASWKTLHCIPEVKYKHERQGLNGRRILLSASWTSCTGCHAHTDVCLELHLSAQGLGLRGRNVPAMPDDHYG